MKRIIALGGKGMTGSYLPAEIPNYDLVDGFDITVPGVLEGIFEKEQPEVVINLAAVTDVVGAENDRARCYEVNTIAAFRVAELCKKYGARLIFISSVDVFDGTLPKEDSYTPSFEVNPIVVYGDSKRLAEVLIRDILPEALILRAGWMFGGFEKDKKFVSYMMKQMLSGQPVIRAVHDIKGSPTYAKDLIAFIMETATYDFNGGTFHFCNQRWATRYDQAIHIAKALGYNGKIEKASMKEFPNFRALKNSKMWSDIETRRWEAALHEYITLWKERIA